MKITIVGGETKFANQAYVANLKDAGNQILAHFDTRHVVRELPVHTDIVLLLMDCTSDMNTAHLNEAAEAVRAKILRVSRRWASAAPHLRAAGLLPASTSKAQPTEALKRDTAIDYISGQRRLGRDPSYDEVTTFLRMNMGPRTKVSRGDLGRWFNEARKTPLTPTVPIENIQTAARALIEERPSLAVAKSHETLFAAVKELAAPEGEFLWPEDLWHVVVSEAERVRGLWFHSVEARKKASLAWATRLWEAYAEGGDIPGSTFIKSEGRALFGKHVPHSTIKEARGKVLGSWALEVQSSNQLQGYLNSQLAAQGQPQTEIVTLLRSGLLDGYQAARRWWTSAEAIDEYIASLADNSEASSADETSTGPFSLPRQEPDPDEVELLTDSDAEPSADAEPEGVDKTEALIDSFVADSPPDLTALEVAIGEIIETRLLDISAQTAELVGDQVSGRIDLGFAEARKEIVKEVSALLRSSLGGLKSVLLSLIGDEMRKHAAEMARIHNDHAGTLLGSVSQSASHIRETSDNIRTWLANISKMVKAIDPEELTPDALMTEVSPAIKALQKSIEGLPRRADSLGRLKATLASLLDGQADLMNRLEGMGGIPQAAAQTGTLADLIKMAANQGLKVSFEPL